MKISTRCYCYLLLWFGFIACSAHLTPYFANDFRYLLITGTDQLVSSVSDIFVSQYRHYFEWGGRTVAHVIAQFLLYLGKPSAPVIQALCYVFLILLIYYNAFGIKPTLKLSLRPLVVITILLFLQLRAYGEVVFNVVSSANYLYTIVIVLAFLLPYRISMMRPLVMPFWLLWPIMLILGVLAGWSNEATSAAVATGLGVYLLWNLHRRALKLWQCIGYLGFLVGFALLILAPGNKARLDSMENNGFDYVDHLWEALLIFGESLLVCGLLLICVAFLLYKINSHCLHLRNPHMYYGSLWFIGMGFFSLFLMIFSPNFPIRASTTYVVFSIIGILGLAKVASHYTNYVLPKYVEYGLFGVFGCFTLAVMFNAMWAYLLLSENIEVRNAEILSQRSKSAETIVVKPLEVRTYKYLYVADVRHDPNYWTNKIVAKFYRVNQIYRTQDFKPNDIHYDWQFFTHRMTEADMLPIENNSTEANDSAKTSTSQPASVASQS